MPIALISRVLGTSFRVTTEQLCETFDLSVTQMRIIYQGLGTNWSQFLSTHGIGVVINESVYQELNLTLPPRNASNRYVKPVKLPFHKFILHRAIIKTIFLLFSTQDNVSQHQTFYIYTIKHDILMDIDATIFVHMSRALNSKNPKLPYGHRRCIVYMTWYHQHRKGFNIR